MRSTMDSQQQQSQSIRVSLASPPQWHCCRERQGRFDGSSDLLDSTRSDQDRPNEPLNRQRPQLHSHAKREAAVASWSKATAGKAEKLRFQGHTARNSTQNFRRAHPSNTPEWRRFRRFPKPVRPAICGFRLAEGARSPAQRPLAADE